MRIGFICLLMFFMLPVLAVDSSRLDDLIMAKQIDLKKIRAMGPEVLTPLADLYEQTEDKLKKAKIAWVFYQLGWLSEAAERVLMRDIHTKDQTLRLQVQWALGRVSSNNAVVMALLDNMRHDSNPLFRDKAACALASDQIHISPEQKVILYKGLIDALADENAQIRAISIQALKIQTGQTKGFSAQASEKERRNSIAQWRQWLKEYQDNL